MADNTQIPLIVLAGPTAVGKTAASIGLAKALNGEIISGDSMQIYRGLDIGTAKITQEEMAGIPHHMIDIREPWESFSVNDFRELADNAIADIRSRGKVPVLVGGTGLYLNSVLYTYHFGDTEQDPAYRESLHQLFTEQGPEALFQLLREQDPVTAKKLHPNDEKRVIRALEVLHVTGVAASQRDTEIDRKELRYPTVYLALNLPRDILYNRINLRVEQMLAQGLEAEVRRTLAEGTPQSAMSMKSIGYRQMLQYINGEIDYSRCVELIQRDTRHFAKRQLTWFRHDENVIWVDKEGKSEEQVLAELLEYVRAFKQ